MRFTSRHWAYLAAFICTAFALGPALAHLFELLNKMPLDQQHYFTVQGIYRGWALFGIPIFGALIALLVLVILLRHQPCPMGWALVAFLAIAGTQAIFWTWTYPANVATNNWTEVPANWQALRANWEYSHAAAAGLDIIAMIALVLSVLAWRDASVQPQAANR
jgi:hypothetical protein